MLKSMRIASAVGCIDIIEMEWGVFDATRRIHSFQPEGIVHRFLNEVQKRSKRRRFYALDVELPEVTRARWLSAQFGPNETVKNHFRWNHNEDCIPSEAVSVLHLPLYGGNTGPSGPRETSEALHVSPMFNSYGTSFTLTDPRPVMRAVKLHRSSSRLRRLRVWCLPSRSLCGTTATKRLLMVYFFGGSLAAKGSP